MIVSYLVHRGCPAIARKIKNVLCTVRRARGMLLRARLLKRIKN